MLKTVIIEVEYEKINIMYSIANDFIDWLFKGSFPGRV